MMMMMMMMMRFPAKRLESYHLVAMLALSRSLDVTAVIPVTTSVVHLVIICIQ